MSHPQILKKEETVLVVIDVQTMLWEVIFEKERVLSQNKKLIEAFKIFDLPIILTEQYPLGMGRTHPEILELLKETEKFEKLSFSCLKKDEFSQKLFSLKRKQIVLTGIESHICVLQTAYDLLEKNFSVFIPYDGVSSRKKTDWENALQRLQKEGVIIGSVESFIFELLESADTPLFRKILKIVK
jgi:nicotinamidase-related amidase